LGSINPVFVTAEAIAERAPEIVSGFLTSVSGSAGQLCTKPGFVFLPTGHALSGEIAAGAAAVPEHRLLNPVITDGYAARRKAVLASAGVSVIAEGSLRIDETGQGWATPTIVSVGAHDIASAGPDLLDESFGPLSVIVEYQTADDLSTLAETIFEGNLTGTVHMATNEDSPALRELVSWLSGHTGRVLFGGWPTGVAVTPAMQHGGPWPATTNDSSTSVGTAAIARFMRPVAYQSAPDAWLPEPLRTSNPWGVPQRVSSAGESLSWGELD
jgi:NADP-dependent aldehyde dehydrogenase